MTEVIKKKKRDKCREKNRKMEGGSDRRRGMKRKGKFEIKRKRKK